jgi:hypothetical protein
MDDAVQRPSASPVRTAVAILFGPLLFVAVFGVGASCAWVPGT